MSRQNILAVAVIALAIGAFFIRKSQRPRSTEADLLTQGVCTAAIEETTRLLGKPGKVLIVGAADSDACPAAVKLRQAFLQAIKRTRGWEVAGTEWVSVPEDTREALPADVYERLLQMPARAEAVISLVGMPALRNRPAPPRHVKVVVVDLFGSAVAAEQAIQNRWVDAAIVPRDPPGPGNPKDFKTPQEWFEHDYQIVTARRPGA